MESLLTKLARAMKRRSPKEASCEVVVLPSLQPTVRGKLLFSYLKDPLRPQSDDYFRGHSNKWEAREIARIFQSLGFEVHAIDWFQHDFAIKQQYDVVFDIYINLYFFRHQITNSLRLMHLTGSDWRYQNAAELGRLNALSIRRGYSCAPQRQVQHAERLDECLALAHHCSLVGNQHTKDTFNKSYHPKIHNVPVSASVTHKKDRRDLVPATRHFLWFSGGGAVHKGLDLTLDAFRDQGNLVLHVVGDVACEKDFADLYRRELFHAQNIHYHGYMDPNSPDFVEIIQKCVAFIAPSCSEGASGAVATCMKLGLYPIVSRDTGIDFVDGCGRFLFECSVAEIRAVAYQVLQMSSDLLAQAIESNQAWSISRYSREAFSQAMREYVCSALQSKTTT